MQRKHEYFSIIVTLLCLWSLGCNRTKSEITNLKIEIQRQLPLGSGKLEVMFYLDRNHIEHTHYLDASGDQEMLSLSGAPGRVNGLIRNVDKGLFYKSSIRLTFLFNREGKLTSYEVNEALTFL